MKKDGVYGLLKPSELSNEAVYLANTEQQPEALEGLIDDLKEAAKVSSPGDGNNLRNAVKYVKNVIKQKSALGISKSSEKGSLWYKDNQ